MTGLPAPIAAIEDAARRADAARLDAVFRDTTGWRPKLWNHERIVGYGEYDYRYESGRSGTFLATGFAPRTRDLSLHILPGYSDYPEITERLGPHRRGKSCWYIRSFASVDEAALRDLIRAGLADLAAAWTVRPT